jgi:hypothetical protein
VREKERVCERERERMRDRECFVCHMICRCWCLCSMTKKSPRYCTPHFQTLNLNLTIPPTTSFISYRNIMHEPLVIKHVNQLLLKFPLLKECDLEAITFKEQFTRIVLASKSIVYAIGAVPYFVDYEGSSSSCFSFFG